MEALNNNNTKTLTELEQELNDNDTYISVIYNDSKNKFRPNVNIYPDTEEGYTQAKQFIDDTFDDNHKNYSDLINRFMSKQDILSMYERALDRYNDLF